MKDQNKLYLLSLLSFAMAFLVAVLNNAVLSTMFILVGAIYLTGGMIVEKLDKLIGDTK